MEVNSIQQVNLMDCCGCEWPTCPDPAKECQSFVVLACGAQLPFESGLVPLEDKCIYYKTVSTHLVVTDTYTGPLPEGISAGGSQIEDNNCIFNWSFTGDPDGRECEIVQASTAYSLESDITQYEDGDMVEQTITSASSSSTGDGPCTGSITTTTNYPDDPGSPETSPFSFCECTPFIGIDLTGYTYEDGVFHKETVTVVNEYHTSTSVHDITYSEPVTLSDLVAEGAARALLYGEEDWPGESCVSSIEYLYTYDNPEDPPVCTQVSGIIYNRYRWTVPPEWIGTRSVLDLTWDEIFFPEVWDEWDQKVEIYEAWEAAYAAWVAGGSVGPEPVEPEEPGPEPEDKPVLVENRDWTWDGISEYSEWFVMGFPPDPGVPGEIRTVNLAVNCWNSIRLGRKPTWHGEIYRLPETP